MGTLARTADLPARLFATVGLGYQSGGQKSGPYDLTTSFTRIAVGVGLKL